MYKLIELHKLAHGRHLIFSGKKVSKLGDLSPRLGEGGGWVKNGQDYTKLTPI